MEGRHSTVLQYVAPKIFVTYSLKIVIFWIKTLKTIMDKHLFTGLQKMVMLKFVDRF